VETESFRLRYIAGLSSSISKDEQKLLRVVHTFDLPSLLTDGEPLSGLPIPEVVALGELGKK
jgi:hypothetical protein